MNLTPAEERYVSRIVTRAIRTSTHVLGFPKISRLNELLNEAGRRLENIGKQTSADDTTKGGG